MTTNSFSLGRPPRRTLQEDAAPFQCTAVSVLSCTAAQRHDPDRVPGLSCTAFFLDSWRPSLKHECFCKVRLHPAAVPLTSTTSSHDRRSSLEGALDSLQQLTQMPPMNELVFQLRKCMQSKELRFVTRVHAIVCQYGLEAHEDIGNYLVPMFVECGSLHDAHQVFHKLLHCNDFTWDSLINGFSECGEMQVSLDFYESMRSLHVIPSKYTFVTLLKACGKLSYIEGGWELHVEIAQHGHEEDLFVGTALVDLYGKCGFLAEAHETFDNFVQRDVVLWTALIAGYAEHGACEEALSCLEKMHSEGISPNAVTYLCSLRACSIVGALEKGQELHREIAEEGFDQVVSVGNTLIDMYSNCGSFAEAQEVFENMKVKDIVSWNSLISGFADFGLGEQALRLLILLREENVSLSNITYSSSLKACANVGLIDLGQELHAEIASEGYEDDPLVGNSLVAMYAKCGYFVEAHNAFDKLEMQHSISWNALIAGYADHGLATETLSLFEQMQVKDIPLSAVTFASILKACSTLGVIDHGRVIHSELAKEEFETNCFVGNALVDFYAKCGSLPEAKELFDELPVRDVISWNALIGGYMHNNLFEEAVNCFHQMQVDGFFPNTTTFLCLVKGCSNIEAFDKGQELHYEIAKEGFEHEPQIGCSFVDFYAKCGSFIEAQEVLSELPVQDVVAWNALISGYVKHGLDEKVLDCLGLMHTKQISLDGVSFVFGLKACGNLSSLDSGLALHSEIVNRGFEKNPFISNTLVDMYAKCGSLAESRKVFDELPDRDVAAWTANIAGYADFGLGEAALKCLEQMKMEGVSPNAVTYVCCLRACSGSRPSYTYLEHKSDIIIKELEGTTDDRILTNLNAGCIIHSWVVKEGFESLNMVGNALMSMYANFGLLTEAQTLCGKLPARDVVSWNILIDGYAEHMLGGKALGFLEQMESEGFAPNATSFVSICKACGSIRAIDKGREMHSMVIKVGLERGPFISSSLIDMYAKCGFLSEAHSVFDKLPVQDVVSWTALMTGFVEQGLPEDALKCFKQMQTKGVLPTSITFLSVLKACGSMKALDEILELHSMVARRGLLESNVEEYSIEIEVDSNTYIHKAPGLESIKLALWNALIDMYGKCGSMIEAQHLFDAMPRRDNVSWNALITGYSRLGKSEQVFGLLERMKEEDKKPDLTTFLSILNISNHLGLVVEGKAYFEAMCQEYGLSPTREHYNSMVDLLGRAGHLDEAMMLIEKMPFLPDLVTWFSILTACRKWGNVELGRQAFECVLKIDSKNVKVFSLMHTIYVNAELWEDARRIRIMRAEMQPSRQFVYEPELIGSYRS